MGEKFQGGEKRFVGKLPIEAGGAVYVLNAVRASQTTELRRAQLDCLLAKNYGLGDC